MSKLHRRDAVFLSADLMLFMAGLSLASPNTLTPAFAERLGAPNVVIGAIPALMTVGWTLPSIFAANFTQGLDRKLPFILKLTTLERVPYPILGAAAIWLAPVSPTATLVLLLLLLALTTVTAGFLMPAWLDVISRAIPQRLRGRFFGISMAGGTLFGIAGAGGVSYLLDHYGFPVGYGLCFFACGSMLVVSYVALTLVREPPPGVPQQRRPTGDYLRRLPRLIADDPNVARLLGARALMVCGGMASGFYVVYALKELGAADADVGIFTVLVLVGQTAATLLFGWVGDRFGHVLVLSLGSLAGGLASALALAAGSTLALYPCFLAMGVSLASVNVSGMAIGLELGTETERPTYTAINNSAVAPFALVSPLVGGLLADAGGYQLLFAIAAAVALVGAAALRFGVREPRRLAAAA